MKKITAAKKLDIIIEHLTDMTDGGYAGDHVWIGNTLAYTSARGGGFGDLEHDAQLGTITKSAMLDWYSRAEEFLDENPDSNISEALHETAS